jgi:hypothetical protein
MDEPGFPEVSLPFRTFLGQNVAGKGLAAHDLPGTRSPKALGGASIGFHFRHFSSPSPLIPCPMRQYHAHKIMFSGVTYRFN